jgi:hypothetical protein
LIFHVLPALEHHTYSEDDVEEGGIKIKKKKMKMAIFLGRRSEKRLKKKFVIPSRHFWMSEGSLNKVSKNIRLT